MSGTRAGVASRGARLAAIALPIAVSLWLLSWLATAALLENEAARHRGDWSSLPQTPWHWDFANENAIVVRGSTGFTRESAASRSLMLSSSDGVADLSLALRGARIDPALVAVARLRLRTPTALQVGLSGENAQGTVLLGSAQVAAGDTTVTWPLTRASLQPLRSLRLRLDGARGLRLDLIDLQLLARDGVAVRACDADPSIAITLARCDARMPRLHAPARWTPERTLAWRDALLQHRPAASIEAPAALPALSTAAPAARAALAPGSALLIVLTGLPLLAAILSHTPRIPVSRGSALLQLLMVFAPWVLLLAAGWPDPDDSAAPRIALAACVAGALLLRDPTTDWRVVGDGAAWRAAAWFSLAALGVLAGICTLNAVDDDGLALRLPNGSEWLRYPAWALLQQLILMRAIAPRMRTLVSDDAGAALATGALFALLHLPNFGLMLATFVAGSVWVWLGLRHRALLPLVAMHASLGLALVAVAPPWLLRSAEIGGRYLIAP